MQDPTKLIAYAICMLCCAAAMVAALWHIACGDLPMAAYSAGFIGLSMIASIFIEEA